MCYSVCLSQRTCGPVKIIKISRILSSFKLFWYLIMMTIFVIFFKWKVQGSFIHLINYPPILDITLNLNQYIVLVSSIACRCYPCPYKGVIIMTIIECSLFQSMCALDVACIRDWISACSTHNVFIMISVLLFDFIDVKASCYWSQTHSCFSSVKFVSKPFRRADV